MTILLYIDDPILEMKDASLSFARNHAAAGSSTFRFAHEFVRPRKAEPIMKVEVPVCRVQAKLRAKSFTLDGEAVVAGTRRWPHRVSDEDSAVVLGQPPTATDVRPSQRHSREGDRLHLERSGSSGRPPILQRGRRVLAKADAHIRPRGARHLATTSPRAPVALPGCPRF
jgi:hypothetical protein